MKKTLFFMMLCVAICDARAADNDMDVWIAACPTCECDADRNARIDTYNSYAGVRVYQNVRAEYAFNPIGAPREKTKKDNMGFGTTMGVRFNKFLRGEYETLYMGAQFSANAQSFEYDIWANMFNGYLYWDFAHTIAPYVGGGVGLTAMWGAIDGNMSNATKISSQALIGVLFELAERIELEVGFKYINFGKISHPGGNTRIDATQFYLGAIYRFGV